MPTNEQQREALRRQAEARRQSLGQLQAQQGKASASLAAARASLVQAIIADPAADTDQAVLRIVVLQTRATLYAQAVAELAPAALEAGGAAPA